MTTSIQTKLNKIILDAETNLNYYYELIKMPIRIGFHTNMNQHFRRKIHS